MSWGVHNMPRRLTLLALAFMAAAIVAGAWAPARASGPPVPDPNFAKTVTASPCGPENQYEKADFIHEGWKAPGYVRYPGACQRLHFTFGPLTVKPGQNDVLIQPVTIEKPAYDGYVTRFVSDLKDPQGNTVGLFKGGS